jgi:NAD+ kinase
LRLLSPILYGHLMMFALFANLEKPSVQAVALGIREFLAERGVELVADDPLAQAINANPFSSVDPQEIDFVISLGGDGTILRLVHRHPELTAPIVGVNLGHLGFMSDIPLADLYPSLGDLLEGHYRIEQRVMMEGRTAHGESCLAVNEIVVHRSPNPSLIQLGIHVNDLYLNTFSADGVIVATPSGSTAYSLAAGGPILTPELEAFVLTPISPHTLSNRPMVLGSQLEIQIQYLSDYQPVEVAYDGIRRFTLHQGEVFHIRRAQRMFQLVSLQRRDYFSVLRTKLGWSGSLRE